MRRVIEGLQVQVRQQQQTIDVRRPSPPRLCPAARTAVCPPTRPQLAPPIYASLSRASQLLDQYSPLPNPAGVTALHAVRGDEAGV